MILIQVSSTFLGPFYNTPNKFERVITRGHFGLCLFETRAGKRLHGLYYLDDIVFKKLRFQMFSIFIETQSRRFKILPV